MRSIKQTAGSTTADGKEAKTSEAGPPTSTELVTTSNPDPLPPEVPVDLHERVVSSEEGIEAMKRQGLVEIAQGTITDIEAVGIQVRGMGVMRIQRGRAMINQQKLDWVVNQLSDEIRDVRGSARKDKGRIGKLNTLGRAIGYLISKSTESQRLVVGIENATSPGGPKEEHVIQNRSFAQRQTIKPATIISAKEVHIHEQK